MGRLYKNCTDVVISWLVAPTAGTDSMRAPRALAFAERYLGSSRLVKCSTYSK